MPHTSSKKKKQERNKRREVIDDDGWTHVTSGPKKPFPKPAPVDFDPDSGDYVAHTSTFMDGSTSTTHFSAPLKPAEDMSSEKLHSQFRRIESKWQESQSYEKLKAVLRASALTAGFNISSCVCFGTGTFSGLRDGWLQRHEVAMYQIAAFKSVVDTIEDVQGTRPAAFAQEPCYNILDGELLSSLSITKVDHPAGFCLLTRNSFAFCPGAEVFINLRTLSYDPAIYLGASLDLYRGRDGRLYAGFINLNYEIDGAALDPDELEDLDAVQYREDIDAMREDLHDDSRIVDAYRKGKETATLPDLDVKDYPFHEQNLTWRVSDQEYAIPWPKNAFI